MATDVQELVETGRFSPAEIAAKTREIYETVLHQSEYLNAGNFTAIHPADVEKLFNLYDRSFFMGGCRKLLGDTPVSFRLSKRMTRAAGKTGRRALQHVSGQFLPVEYEIVISTTLLFQSFHDENRPVILNGIRCRDRLEAVQRVLEHEIVHLIEMLLWHDSSCAAPRFQSIANRFFGHTGHTHELMTPRERALTKYGVKLGDKVSFRFDGQHYVGFVNRITRRATVLVEHERGAPYSDGKKYAKFYVPVQMLEPVESLPTGRER